MFINNEEYINRYKSLTNKTIYGKSAQRGKIYDRNGKVLVDNVGVKSIYYKRSGSLEDELSTAKILSDILDITNKASVSMKEDLYLVMYDCSDKITTEEWNLYHTRKLSNSDILLLERERITSEELSLIDDKMAYIYYLMNNGYSYEEKLIMKDISDEVYALLNEKNLNGVILKLSWDRDYIYEDTLRGIFGNVSKEEIGLTKDVLEHYKSMGYDITDRVGISGLEYYYDAYLQGKRKEYKYVDNKLYVTEEKSGNDLYLTIDIDMQLELERIVEEELISTKNEPNTEYFNSALVVLSEPTTGDIIALTYKVINNGVVYDYTSHLLSSSFTVGSVIKGASISVGYKYGAIDIGTVMKDECIKLASTPLKCSWNRYLGNLSDIDALRLSSNSYQFKIAMRVSGSEYYYGMPFKINNDAFNKYRTMFNSYGLGVLTNIDLPNETTGIKGDNDTDGLLLDFSIGQYDTYTILQLSQYINTIANNGTRLELNLVDYIKNNDEIVYKDERSILNNVDLDSKYLDRIKEGFKAVMGYNGLGYGYIPLSYNPAGKTGTSQSFFDSDKDGIIDKETVTSTFAGYAPIDNPEVSIAVITPNVSHIYGSSYTSNVNKRITSRVITSYFENKKE